MSARKTRDMKVRTPQAKSGVKADFLVELSGCRTCLRRLAELAKALPEGDEFHDARDRVGTILNRVVQLEEQALRWGAR